MALTSFTCNAGLDEAGRHHREQQDRGEGLEHPQDHQQANARGDQQADPGGL
jgi:hypothetical protein